MQLYGVQSTALRYFLEVVRCGSISEASQRLNVAASAVSRQVAKLERDMDCSLFERRARGMVLSESGARLAAYARKSELEALQVISEIKELHGLQRGLVRIACSEGFAMEFLPKAIADFRNAYGGIHFTLEVFPPALATAKARSGEVDLALTFSLSPEREIKVEYAAVGVIHAIVSNNHPLATRAHVSLAELQPYPIALPMANTTLRQLFDICCGVQGLYFEPVLTSNYFGTLYRFVMDEGGISLAGELTVHNRIEHKELRALPITDAELQARRIELQSMAGRTLPSAVAAFRDFLVGRLTLVNTGAK
ncbi:LysR family transcriptional regulator [Pseudomonas typographi]|uniref:LysR family transcriptional regulator n=1 Tax=Pseudomonas typographi TaxID=2715964 RepID=A0ABR7Z972_9PSED|nr:LysR family transcriptional regulator [Pseudomonas typographi]MBD1553183.1 LysR family transcriptional regulator [Pseudomonas typographi]MBD1585828.1 LysR family transcriptional regulator [Pseudomonas typographi]MBD1601869.1 LysR family transcriptional regulator [Pseudomonas typographi]